MTNPTPVAWAANEYTNFSTNKNLMLRNGWKEKELEPLFTEAQLQQARADALREAAEKFHCKRLVGKGDFWPEVELRRMADEIEGEK